MTQVEWIQKKSPMRHRKSRMALLGEVFGRGHCRCKSVVLKYCISGLDKFILFEVVTYVGFCQRVPIYPDSHLIDFLKRSRVIQLGLSVVYPINLALP